MANSLVSSSSIVLPEPMVVYAGLAFFTYIQHFRRNRNYSPYYLCAIWNKNSGGTSVLVMVIASVSVSSNENEEIVSCFFWICLKRGNFPILIMQNVSSSTAEPLLVWICWQAKNVNSKLAASRHIQPLSTTHLNTSSNWFNIPTLTLDAPACVRRGHTPHARACYT